MYLWLFYKPEKGTMMRRNKEERYPVKNRKNSTVITAVVMNILLVCSALAGCGIRDSALVIPIGETGAASEIAVTEPEPAKNETAEPEGSAVKTEETAAENGICVYVCGAVREPGVVELAEGSRAEDALRAAGGFAEDAKEDYVNLAAKLEDGQKLYFPNQAEAEMPVLPEQPGQEGLVNINTADISQLTTLPGIGEARAGDIIAYREKNGAFRSREELKKVSGIKESVYAKLCDRIVVQ